MISLVRVSISHGRRGFWVIKGFRIDRRRFGFSKFFDSYGSISKDLLALEWFEEASAPLYIGVPRGRGKGPERGKVVVSNIQFTQSI